jgi:hypothetical protein
VPKVLPSQLVEAIDNLFGANRNELDVRMVTHVYRAEVHALLTLLDEVPRELIDLRSSEYLEFTRCRAVLAISVASSSAIDTRPRCCRPAGVPRAMAMLGQPHQALPIPSKYARQAAIGRRSLKSHLILCCPFFLGVSLPRPAPGSGRAAARAVRSRRLYRAFAAGRRAAATSETTTRT